ncbi:MAG: hypothetical protein JF887_09195 [Candidatus Dormibacteraeota bacterium]|uniref:DUF4383 domain-containing protein n=1 Tax=Candidatus Amunia macphersoniae TaxID=3127014 RepID=A0A934KPN7_9BACT|nr:hypothetical protein [Candidatus Dormibacteraeota bacterium]
MARLYAQLCAAVFLVVGVGGLVAGNAGPPAANGGGNIGGLILHLTWARDAVDLALLAVFVYIGFVGSRRVGRLLAGGLGAVLLALAIVGFLVGDDAAATRSYAGLHFTTALNILDLVVGVLGILAALGTVEGPEPAPRSVLRG